MAACHCQDKHRSPRPPENAPSLATHLPDMRCLTACLGVQEKFLNEAAGKEMTVADYFKQQYNIQLTNRQLPCIAVGNGKVLLPPELCTIAPGQVGGAGRLPPAPLRQLHGRRQTRANACCRSAMACTSLHVSLFDGLPVCMPACLTSSALQRRAKLTEFQTAEMIKTAAQVGAAPPHYRNLELHCQHYGKAAGQLLEQWGVGRCCGGLCDSRLQLHVLTVPPLAPADCCRGLMTRRGGSTAWCSRR